MEGDYFREQFVVELVEQVSFLFQAVFQEKHQLLLYFSFLAMGKLVWEDQGDVFEKGLLAFDKYLQ